MKKVILLLAMLTSINIYVNAQEVDGIFYSVHKDNGEYTYASVASLTEEMYNDATEINIPATVTVEYDMMYYIEKVTVPVREIYGHAFDGCKSVRKITIANSVEKIGDRAMANCKQLETVQLPNNIDCINEYMFAGCEKLTYVNIPSSVREIKEYAFYNCSSLTDINWGGSEHTIWDSAFSKCTSLKELNIPISITDIHDFAFGDCTSLEKVIIPESVVNFGFFIFKGCSSLKEVVFPNNMNIIPMSMFEDCVGLEHFTIPDGITTIVDLAFNNCKGLKTVDLPPSIMVIGDSFGGCHLEHINCDAMEIPNALADPFSQWTYDNALLRVRRCLLEDYKVTYPWNKFYHISAIDDDSINQTTEQVEKWSRIFNTEGKSMKVNKGILILRKNNGETRKIIAK